MPATTAKAPAAAVGSWTSLVHNQVAPGQVGAIQRGNGLLGLVRVHHFDEREAARAARVAVLDQKNRVDLAVGFKRRPDFVFGRGEIEIADVESLHESPRLEIESGLRPGRRGRSSLSEATSDGQPSLVRVSTYYFTLARWMGQPRWDLANLRKQSIFFELI